MLYVRTASGSFINASTIMQLSPQRDGGDEDITGWLAICEGGKAVALAPWYAVPGRIDGVLEYAPAGGSAAAEFASAAAVSAGLGDLQA